MRPRHKTCPTRAQEQIKPNSIQHTAATRRMFQDVDILNSWCDYKGQLLLMFKLDLRTGFRLICCTVVWIFIFYWSYIILLQSALSSLHILTTVCFVTFSHCVCMEYTLAMNSFNSLNVFELVLNYLYLLNISLWVSNFSCPCLSLIVLLQDEYTYYLHESIIVFCNHKLIGFWVCL